MCRSRLNQQMEVREFTNAPRKKGHNGGSASENTRGMGRAPHYNSSNVLRKKKSPRSYPHIFPGGGGGRKKKGEKGSLAKIEGENCQERGGRKYVPQGKTSQENHLLFN